MDFDLPLLISNLYKLLNVCLYWENDQVVYEDGDEEDLDLDEVKEILLPRGTLPKSVSKKRGHPGEESDQERYATISMYVFMRFT